MNEELETKIQSNWLTMKQAAQLCNVSTRTLYAWKRLPGFPRVRKIGAVARVNRQEIEHWMDSQWEGGK
ncbi:MAG: helix-turn-helix domain-containing protein [Planctomycetia bacterium]|nr:helix-turn-helix domain-containing protein [Planctomycetia bacterium]